MGVRVLSYEDVRAAARPGPLEPNTAAAPARPALLDLPGAPAVTLPSRHPFAALRHRNFALFYWGQFASLSGTWMQTTAQGWLVLELTNSPLALGFVTAAGSLPVLLFTLYAGVVADRMDKRRIVTACQAASMVLALLLALLTYTHRIDLPLLLVLVFLAGTASAFEVPTRQAMFVDLVGKPDLTNAIALNSSAFNATRIIGPAVAGALIGSFGVAACFLLNGVSYLFVIAALLAMRLPRFRRPISRSSTLENLREGLVFIRRNTLAFTLVAMIAAMSVTAFPYSMLLPVFARDILHVGARGLGWLLAASGAGALAGGAILATAGNRLRKGPLLVAASLAFTLFLAGFALSRSFALSLVLLAALGCALILTSATVNSLLQALVPDALRGRVMSVYVFVFLGMAPLGALQAGAMARWVGAPVALALGAGVLFLLVLTVATRVPEVRRAH